MRVVGGASKAMKAVRNYKVRIAADVTVYQMERIVDGERYGVEEAFTLADLAHRDLVAYRLRRARESLRSHIADVRGMSCAWK